MPTGNTERCPVTGLPVLSRPEWTDLSFGDRYRLTVRVLGGAIVHAQPRGFATLDAVRQATTLTREIVDEVVGPARTHVHLADYTALDGASTEARRHFVKVMKNRQGMIGMVFFGVPFMLRIAIQLSSRLLRGRPRAVLADDLPQALRAAVAMLDSHGVELVEAPSRSSADRTTRAEDESVRSETDPDPGSGVADLLRYLGAVDWEVEGVPERDQGLGATHPFATILDAIELVKTDVDQLFAERKKAERALRESEARYRGILESIVDGYYEVDLEGNMEYFNEPVPRLIGLTADQASGMSFREYMDVDTARRAFATFNRVMKTGQPARTHDWELIHQDGSRVVVETSISLRHDSKGEPVGFRGIVRDITDRVRADDERRRLRDQLLHAQRMEALGTLAGGIAHNFNNLLMGIQGHVSFMIMETAAEHPHSHRLHTIESLVQGGARLTAQLLGYARAGRTEAALLDVNELARTTADTFGLTNKSVRVDLDLDDELPQVAADRGQIEQVLLNLLINAGDATKPGGAVRVRTRQALRSPPDTELSRTTPSPFICLSVIDTGNGMDAKTVDRVFEPFFTTKGMTGGTGLGLSTAYGAAKAHGGFIEVHSEVGRGSTFEVFLPVTTIEPTPASTSEVDLVSGRGRALVVEDDDAVLEAVADMVSRLRFAPIRASTGGEAVEKMRQHGSGIDLVLLDVILPDMDGGQVFDAIREIRPQTRIVLISGYSQHGEPERLLARGCDGFIQKPFTIEQLSQKIGEILG